MNFRFCELLPFVRSFGVDCATTITTSDTTYKNERQPHSIIITLTALTQQPETCSPSALVREVLENLSFVEDFKDAKLDSVTFVAPRFAALSCSLFLDSIIIRALDKLGMPWIARIPPQSVFLVIA